MCLVNIHGFFHKTHKKGEKLATPFQKFLKESKCKPNMIWRDKYSRFYNR